MYYVGNNAANARIEFENAKIALAKAGYSPMQIEDAVLTQSFIRLEQLLTANATNFSFPVLVNDTGNNQAIRPTEKRLNLQDAFYVSGISITLLPAASATATNLNPQSYPNTILFPTGAGSLYTFYNGQLSITVNNSVLMPGYSLMNFMIIPQTQQTAATNSPQAQFYGAEKMAFQPNPVLIGQKKTVVNIILPGNITTIDAFTYARIEFSGVLAQNVTVVS